MIDVWRRLKGRRLELASEIALRWRQGIERSLDTQEIVVRIKYMRGLLSRKIAKLFAASLGDL